jgi:hypothetical protein
MTTQPASGDVPQRAAVLGTLLLAAGMVLAAAEVVRKVAPAFFVPVIGLLAILGVSAWVPSRRHWAWEALIGAAVLVVAVTYIWVGSLGTAIEAATGAMVLGTAGAIQWAIARGE